MTMFYPIWLLLAVPLAVSLWLWPMPSRLLLTMRIATWILVLAGLCGLAIRMPSRAGTVVVVADRSLSMPAGATDRQMEIIHAVQKAMGGHDKMAVVSFGQSAAIEQSPQTGKFTQFVHDVGRDASVLDKALGTALSLVPLDSPGRLLVVSDGRYTGADPAGAAAQAASRNIGIDHFLLQRPLSGDLAIERLDTPAGITPGEAYMINAWVRNGLPREVSYQLERNGTIIAQGRRALVTGLSRLTFRDRAERPGTAHYVLRIAAPGKDPVPENNHARLLVGIDGPRPMLVVTPAAESQLPAVLAGGRLDVQAATAERVDWSLEALAGYSAVLLENIPAQQVGKPGMANLAAWVKQTGAGLMMTGGESSFGPGGYFKSPLEPVMPVSMELRREHRKLAVAIVIALDRSGSMSMTVPGGRTKMDLANLGAVQVVEMLSGMDELGVWAVDSSPHKIVELQELTDKQAVTNKIRHIGSQGGGIFVYEALKASVSMVSQAKAGTKHIVLFSDAQDSEQPGQYRQLLDKAHQAGITVSVIGLGKPTDVDAGFLRDVAKRGNGRCFFTEDPADLPRLFAQDTIVVARSAFIAEPVKVKTTGGMIPLTGQRFADPPAIGGYNLCYLRPGANLAAVSLDEYEAPVLAAWQAGTGRALCYTGEADGEHTGNIAHWPKVGEFLTSLARWTAGQADQLGPGMLVTQEVRGGQALVQLHLDPERRVDPFDELPQVNVLRGRLGQTPQSTLMTMRWADADTLSAQVTLTGDETAIATVRVGEDATASMAPVCLPYSPEFKPLGEDIGAATLAGLSRATGGMTRDVVHEIWDDLPKHPRLVEMRPWLLVAAMVMLILEVFERRSGLLSAPGIPARFNRRRAPEKRQAQPPSTPTPATGQTSVQPAAAPAPSAKPGPAEPGKTDQPQARPQSPDVFDAMRRAQRRAHDRTRKRQE